MINKLRKIFSSLVVYQNEVNYFDNNYKWFIMTDQTIIGISKNELTTKDSSLMATFLLPYNIDFPIPTQTEKTWENVLYRTEISSNLNLSNPYRFVYFSMKENQINPSSFKDAIQELFSQEIPILWINNHEGIIVEEQELTRESISYEQIIDILMSDLYVNINFFVGPFQKNIENVKKYYKMIIDGAEAAFIYSKKPVVTYPEAVPMLFVHQMDSDTRKDITKLILQDYIDDEETLRMIDVFVQCNLNISETAKELYMHRNSLQYRLDRFHDKTSIDIRQFHNAMTVYLTLIANK